MPAKGSTLDSGPRDMVIDEEFYKKVKDKYNLDIDYKTFKNIILTSNNAIKEIIANDEGGFKLPENLGYIVVTKYKSKKRPIDWVATKKLKKVVYLPNLHSFGYIHHIKWFRIGLTVNFGTADVYKFESCRDLSRSVAKNVKEYKVYHTWSNSDFWSSSKTLKRIFK